MTDPDENNETTGTTRDDPTDRPDDPRLSDGSGEQMATSTIDSAHNMPGDQPENTTPPPLGRATGTDDTSSDSE